jgi:heat shock protein HtpX
MIMALRKIEGRGELPGATSAIMEMCVDNPRESFADLFATHPSIATRVEALVKFAGGRDPGPISLSSRAAVGPAADEGAAHGAEETGRGPWGPVVPRP